ncbi:PREDICTED: uncharacterized protein LOC101315205 [Fragaria vesca subsp. vesca]
MAKAKLCVVTDRGVYRLPLDISKLRNREKVPPKLYVPPHVEFEKLEGDINNMPFFVLSTPTVDFFSLDGEIPYYFMHPVVVEDDLLLVGGWVPFLSFNPNIDVAYEIAFDRLRPIPSPLRLSSNPDLCSWFTTQSKRDVFFYRFKSSNYVLDATDPQQLSFHRLQLFYHGCTQEVLPNPPDDIRVLSQTGWGHKFHIITRPNHCPTTLPSLSSINPSLHTALLSDLSPVAYTFDLYEERWYRCRHQFTAAVEYQGFLIGLAPSGKLVCCPLDSHGNPDELTPSRVLHNMFDICMLRGFSYFDADSAFMGLYKDGEVDYIWLVYTLQGPDADVHVHMPFVLFQVFIQNGVLCTIVEASDHYDFLPDSFLCKAFVCADPLNSGDEIDAF